MFPPVSVSRWSLRSAPAPQSVCPGSCNKRQSKNGMSSQRLTWPCIRPPVGEQPEQPQDSKGQGERPNESVVNQKQENKNSLEHNRNKPASNARLPSPYTLQTVMGFSIHCLILLCDAFYLLFLQEAGWMLRPLQTG